MPLFRLQRLDADGAPVGEPTEFADGNLTLTVAEEPDFVPCSPLKLRTMAKVNFTCTVATTKQIERLLLGPRLALKWQRAARHRARIVVVPKRRLKHGRVGVYR